MSDDTRSNHAKAPKLKRILVVHNPSPDDDYSTGSDDFRRLPPASSYSSTSLPYQPRPLPPSPVGPPAHHDHLHSFSASHIPAPLTTNLPDHRVNYPSSRSNPSNSSPSSTSSRAFESTPPPTTPGQSLPPVDLSGESTLRHEHTYVVSSDRNDSQSQQSSRTRQQCDHFIPQLPRPSHNRRGSNNRPVTSPTVLTSDSSQPATSFRSSPSEKVTLLVTADADNFSIVDITGAMTPAFIRERIFTKLQISDEDQPRFSIYRTEIGKYAIGDALTDEQLFDLYRDRGDAKGTVKLFVSHSSAPVHELLDDSGLVSPTVNTIPPPVLPQHSLSAPLQPRRTRSRQDSQSSASEHQQAEGATGYEASISDDLEHGEKETRRSTMKPPSQQRALGPQSGRSPAQSYRPHSPVGDVPDDRQRISSLESGTGRPDTYRGSVLPFPPPTHTNSPQNTRFSDATHPSPPLSWEVQGGSMPDGMAERERGYHVSEVSGDPTERPRRLHPDERDHLRRKDSAGRRDVAPRRPKPPSHDHSETKRSQESWTVVPSDVPTSTYRNNRPTTPQDSRSPSSSRIHNGGFIGMPRTPPNASSGSGESRRRNKVPYGWAVGWKSTPSKTEQKSAQPVPTPAPNPFQSTRLMAKSMTDMRNMYKTQQSQYPPALQPGRPSRPQAPLPVVTRPGTGGSTTSASGQNSASTQDGLPASYHEPSHMDMNQRSYDMQRSAQSPTSHHSSRANGASAYSPPVPTGLPYLGAVSPSNDPYPGPQSAVDDTGTILQRPPLRPILSPRGPDHAHDVPPLRSSPLPTHYTSVNGHNYGLEDHVASNIVSTPVSSHPSLPSAVADGSTSNLDTPNRSGARQPSPPSRSPIDIPRNPNRSREDVDGKAPDAQSYRPSSSIQRGIIDEDNQDDATLARNAHAWLAGFIDENMSEDATAKPRPKVPAADAKVNPPSNTLEATGTGTSTGNTSNSLTLVNDGNEGDSDSDSGSGIWAVKPRENLDSHSTTRLTRPPLPPLSIENSASSNPTPLMSSSHIDTSRIPPPGFPAPPDYIPQAPPPRLPRRNPSKAVQDQRTSRFDNDYDYTWAPRPPPEDVYERLEEYFPEHDLDKPLIETLSGGTSPTSEQMVSPPQRSRHKKSIRVVAAERKRLIDRTSRMEASSNSATAVLHKRGTKMWGSRLEEVTTEQARSGLPSSKSSPGNIAKPIFHWVRGELIGKGTYGKVYLALNATTGEMIAVKQVEMPRTASDKDNPRQVSVVEALKLESETLKDLDHSNIVQYLGFEETPTFLSIFLEYVPGGSIASCLRKHGKFDEEVTKSFTGQILSGLEYLHSKGILHRDLKADNILVETTGTCKISDFGISRRTDDIDIAGAYTSMQGSVFWMAPEVIDSGQSGYNSKIDIWSVGCVVFEMWTGQRPWNGQEAMAVILLLYRTKQGPPVPSNVSLSPLADDFRQRCFAMDPDERPTAAELRKHSYLELRPGWIFNGFK